jgi:hypothetical protein
MASPCCAASGAGISYAVVSSLGSLDTGDDARDPGRLGRFDPESPGYA